MDSLAPPAGLIGDDPIAALSRASGPAALVVLTGVEGAAYRSPGALMAVFDQDSRIGSLSSGCVDAAIAAHAMEAVADGKTRQVRYGAGSPYLDLQLPCGGGLDVLILPRPDRKALAEILAAQQARRCCTLSIDPKSGALSVSADAVPGRFAITFTPVIQAVTIGKGMEAVAFARLAHAAGWRAPLLSPDVETLETAARLGLTVSSLPASAPYWDTPLDRWTAVALFFHDHELEPPILRWALGSDAFYIGAQGSRRSREARHAALGAMGVGPDALARLKGPIGLIPRARDPETLAISVLAEIAAEARP